VVPSKKFVVGGQRGVAERQTAFTHLQRFRVMLAVPGSVGGITRQCSPQTRAANT
jgi:hypothetical protein